MGYNPFYCSFSTRFRATGLIDVRLFVRVSSLESPLKLASLFISGVGNVNGNLLAKVLGDFLKSQAGGFGEEEVDH